MAKTALILTGAALGAFLALAAILGATAGPADAGYGVDEIAPKVISNAAKKGDMTATAQAVAAKRQARPAIEVAEIRKIGNDFLIRDSKGQTVYRSDAATRTTTVAKNTELPLLTGYGVAVGKVEAAFQATSN
jgi:hypothetical protein